MEPTDKGVKCTVRHAIRFGILSLSLCVLALAGCEEASLESRLVGQWTGHVDLAPNPSLNPMVQMAASKIQPTLNLREDKTFNMTVAVVLIQGTWKVEEGRLALDVNKVAGQSKEDFKASAQKRMATNPFVPKVDFDKADRPITFDIGPEAKTIATQDLGKGLAGISPFTPSGTVRFKRLGSGE